VARPQEFDAAEALHRALGVFWKKGYEASSLADLLAATGLSKSSLYATFGGKRELFLAAYDAYREERKLEMGEILEGGPARQDIEAFFRKIIADAPAPEFSHGCMSTNQAVELAPHDPEIRGRVEADFQLIEDALARTIERGQADGSVKSTRSARKLARLLVVAFPGFQVMVRAGADRSRLEDALGLLLANLD
jgi:TetR/AcrR family transcriptional repressor of nem operon